MSAIQSPYVGSESSLVPLTGFSLVDSFLGGSKWGTGPVGSPASITFGFPDVMAVFDTAAHFGFYGSADFSGYLDSIDFGPFGTEEQAAVRDLLHAWANVANLSFAEVAVDSPTAATLRFNYSGPSGLGDTSFAASWFPMDIPAAGDTWVNIRFLYPDGWATGTQNRLTLLHEIGHALGLKHPHDTGLAGLIDGWPATLSTQPFIDSYVLSHYSTADAVMAYNDLPGTGNPVQADFAPTTPMRLDIAAIQYLYGANSAFNAGDTTYTFQSDGHYYQTIWDGGGTDTIASSGSKNVVINLNPGSWSNLGLPITYSERDDTLNIAIPRPDLATFNTVMIYDTVVIENATGGNGFDRLIGNAVDNWLQGGGGNDELIGGNGIDAAIFTGNRGNYTITSGTEKWTVQDNIGHEGTDRLFEMERLFFTDAKIALDLDGNAGMVAKLLGAVFSPGAVTNAIYAGIGLSLLDEGMSYTELAQFAIDASGASSPVQVVNLLWGNIVGGAPTFEQAQPFIDMLLTTEDGITTGVLTALAADTELNQNNINLLGLAQTGLDYIAYTPG